jgi:hypothetical protein
MSHNHAPSEEIEAFQRWAIAVDDQLREAVDAVVALEDPEAGPIAVHSHALNSDRSSGDLAAEAVGDAQRIKKTPTARPGSLRVSRWSSRYLHGLSTSWTTLTKSRGTVRNRAISRYR